jgi:phenylacetate-CoA ligase
MRPLTGYVSNVTHSTFFSVKASVVDVIKFGPPFSRVLEELETSQWYTGEQFAEIQERKLRALIRHAYENVRYYRRLFDQLRLKPDDIANPGDLKKLPVLDKETVRNHQRDLVARNFSRARIFPGWTTGTTGTPLNALRSRASIVFENAMIWRQRRMAGLKFRCRKAAIWGTIWENVIVPAGQRVPPFWRFNATDNQLLLSYYHISDATLPEYIARLKAFAPEFIEGFPSSILILARYLKKANMTIPMKAIYTSSETLYDVHRKDIEQAFASRVFDLYGQAERAVAATECERHAGLHINPEYGIFEIIKDGQDAPPGTTGDVVGTGLNNYVMPLIRYRTGDLATLASAPCPCGRQMPLLSGIQGRKADVIRTPDGRIVPGNGLMGAFHGIGNIERSQVIQERLDYVVVNLQREDLTRPVDTNQLRLNLKQCLGERVEIEFRLPDQIDNGGQSKFRWVTSHLPAGQ